MKNPGKDSFVSDSLGSSLGLIEVFVKGVAEKYSLSYNEVLDLLKKKENEEIILVPSFILRDGKLGILEAVTKYLKEELSLTYHKIAVLLNRDDRVVWMTYSKASKKKKDKFIVREPNKWIPVSVFAQKLSPLAAISKYLVDGQKMKLNEVAELLNRDPRSIWAAYNKHKNPKK